MYIIRNKKKSLYYNAENNTWGSFTSCTFFTNQTFSQIERQYKSLLDENTEILCVTFKSVETLEYEEV